MKLGHGLHLAYCTNIHRGESWAETFAALETYTLAVRERVCPRDAYAIGLRLSQRAAQELSDPPVLRAFQSWLEQKNCYVFTINGFPYGQFHGGRVKEQVYLPDWSSEARLAYTNMLFDLLSKLMPPGVEGSVSTVPCGFKELLTDEGQLPQMRANLFKCVEHVAALAKKTGRALHLGLEPEPLCILETTAEVIDFFGQLRTEHGNDERLGEYLGVNYDTCHLAVEFEEPALSIAALKREGIRLSKFHLSSALKAMPTPETRRALGAFVENVYLHQVVARYRDGSRKAYRDLGDALTSAEADSNLPEWRIHFHVPLHSEPTALFGTTSDHLIGVLDLLKADPGLCSHLEMETYTWEVLPAELRNRNVVEQLTAEYEWTLARLAERGLR